MSLANCYTDTDTKTYASTSGASNAAAASISKFCQESDIPMAANSRPAASLGDIKFWSAGPSC